jgi:alkylated DNA repair protein (DNA oxidative demethylase)
MTPPETAFLPLGAPERPAGCIDLGPQAAVLVGFARGATARLYRDLQTVAAVSPFRRMVTPGGFEMSVAATNCGAVGWVTDRAGYRYDVIDPETGASWPDMPASFRDIAVAGAAAVGFSPFDPDACLLNRYAAGARLSLHQDRNERDFDAPVVTVSLGLPAIFQWGGAARSDRPTAVRLDHGDVMVWGGPDRLNFHGVKELAAGEHPLTGPYRYSLTFRRAL